MYKHLCIDVRGALNNLLNGDRSWIGAITYGDKLLTTKNEVKDFFNLCLWEGKLKLPIGDCDNFDYQTGCKGHSKIEAQDA